MQLRRTLRGILLAVAVLALGLPVPPAALANSPSPGQSAAAGEFDDIASKLLADPIGRAGMVAHQKLNMMDGNRNLAVVWFDLTDFQPFHLDSITKTFGENPNYADYYSGYGRMLNRAGNEALFDRIGIAGDGPMLEFAAVNDPRRDHSEAVIYDQMLDTVLGSLGLRDSALTKLKKRAIAGFSDRGRCGPCLKLTSAIPEKNFVAGTPYETDQDRKASANRVGAINQASNAQLNREEKQHKQQADTAMPVKSGPCPENGAAMSLQLSAAATPCSGALDQALSPSSTTYGGVDFSTLEMRYLSDSSDGLQYAYSAQPLPGGYQQDGELGAHVVKNLGDDLRTWLVLDPQKFWVNLNPTEPDRIVDQALGQTNAGKAMLEADLQMKRTEAKILHPDSPTGAKYWQQFQPGPDGSLCFSARLWIVPGQVEVREDGGSLYVLNAQLDVKTQADHINDPYSQQCKADAATDARNEELERTLVLPEVIKAVNTAPEYAPLRRAFMARIVAEWVRQRHLQGKRSSFDSIIDSKDLGPAKLTDGWRPKQVFDDYVHSYRDKEFDVTRSTTDASGTERVTRYVFGGADLTHVQLTAVSAADTERRYPHLTQAAQGSTTKQIAAPDGSLWLGRTVQVPAQSLWGGLKDDATRLTRGNGPLLALLLLALAGVLFGLRTRRGGGTG